MKILILLLLITISIAHASTSRQIYKDVVLGEIQATFVRDYNVSQQYFGPVQKGPTKKIVKKKELPNLKPEPNLSPTPDLSPRPKRRIKRGLIGLDDEDDENDGWLGKKGKGKKKKGLIEDNDFTPEPIKLNKRTVKGIIQPNKNITPKRNDWTSKKLRDLNKWQKTSKEETNKWYQDKAKI